MTSAYICIFMNLKSLVFVDVTFDIGSNVSLKLVPVDITPFLVIFFFCDLFPGIYFALLCLCFQGCGSNFKVTVMVLFYIFFISLLLTRSIINYLCNIHIKQCCASGMFIPDPGSWFLPILDPGSRFPDPGSKNSNKREGWKKISCQTFFCSHKFHKIENYFIF